jgi:hypothetical protein
MGGSSGGILGLPAQSAQSFVSPLGNMMPMPGAPQQTAPQVWPEALPQPSSLQPPPALAATPPATPALQDFGQPQPVQPQLTTPMMPAMSPMTATPAMMPGAAAATGQLQNWLNGTPLSEQRLLSGQSWPTQFGYRGPLLFNNPFVRRS